MSWNTLGLFRVTFFISTTPGSNMLLAISLGLRFGVRRAAWLGMVSGLEYGHRTPDASSSTVSLPQITFPKSGGVIAGIGEKFSVNAASGTGTFSMPNATSPGRSGFGPALVLSYDSAAGNGPFGFGWRVDLPATTRKTDNGLPLYDDAGDTGGIILSGAEDLVPVLVFTDGRWSHPVGASPATEPGCRVTRYRPRIEGLFARIERWTDVATGVSHWRSISRDNVTTLYGAGDDARIADPATQPGFFPG